jgi:excisionase family DNA binding protein
MQPGTNSTHLSGKILLSVNDLAAQWRIPVGTLYNWVSQGRLPHLKLGRCLRFDPQQIDAWAAQRRMGTTSRR